MALHGYEAIRAAALIEASLRQAKLHICQRCRAECMRGDDNDNCAMTATVDIDPIDAFGESLAVLSRRGTYDLIPMSGKTAKPGAMELHHRQNYHYLKDERKWPVLVEHRCEVSK